MKRKFSELGPEAPDADRPSPAKPSAQPCSCLDPRCPTSDANSGRGRPRASEPSETATGELRRGWNQLPRDIQLHIFGFTSADDAMRQRSTSKQFARAAIEQLRKPNAAACNLAHRLGIRMKHIKWLFLDQHVKCLDGDCFPNAEVLEISNWYASTVLGAWDKLKKTIVEGSGERSGPLLRFDQNHTCGLHEIQLSKCFDIILPGRYFTDCSHILLKECASFQFTDTPLEEVDPTHWDDENFDDWSVPNNAWDKVGLWRPLETMRIVKPGYGIALAAVFPNLHTVEILEGNGEPVLFAGKFPALRRIIVDHTDNALLTGTFPNGMPEVKLTAEPLDATEDYPAEPG